MVTILKIVTGEQLRILRVTNKLSQTELGELLNVTRNTIARWERIDDLSSTLTLKQAQILSDLFKEMEK